MFSKLKVLFSLLMLALVTVTFECSIYFESCKILANNGETEVWFMATLGILVFWLLTFIGYLIVETCWPKGGGK
jgi:hypothetical protein